MSATPHCDFIPFGLYGCQDLVLTSLCVRKPTIVSEQRVMELGIDLEGRVRNTVLAQKDAPLPIFEAIVNSIHAIEDRFGADVQNGRIDVSIERTPQDRLQKVEGDRFEEVVAVAISDNGEGFTDENFKSFLMADSQAKLGRGGKGVGRLSWLVVFEHALVESTYESAEGIRSRSFRFDSSGVSQLRENPSPTPEMLGTRVRLVSPRKKYRKAIRRTVESFASGVFGHCFSMFIAKPFPEVAVFEADDPASSRVSLSDLASNLRVEHSRPLQVGSHQLQLRHVVQPERGGPHLGHLLAHSRVVEEFRLADVSGIQAGLAGTDGRAFVHHAFISGDALDEAVDATRTHFLLPDGSPVHQASGELDLRSLREAVGTAIDERYADDIAAERKANLERVRSYVRTEQPEYSRLVHQQPERVAGLKLSSSPRANDELLYRAKQDWEFEIRTRRSQVDDKLADSDAPIDEIFEIFQKLLVETSQAGQDDLVRYVLKRRAVLKTLLRLLKRDRGTLEKEIHGIVFPMRKDKDEVPYDEHNLWLVDDQLAFYEHLASDLQFRQNQAAPSDSLVRPDVVAFKTGDPYQHVSLIEFKKPDAPTQNPVEQLARYARTLRTGGAVGINGATVPGIDTRIRIDAFGVCTLDPKTEELLRDGPGEMQRVEGEWRWYGSMSNLNMTIEVLDFHALLTRAKQRNSAFFRALQLPPE